MSNDDGNDDNDDDDDGDDGDVKCETIVCVLLTDLNMYHI